MIYIMFDCSSRVLFTALRASTFDDTAFGDGTAYATSLRKQFLSPEAVPPRADATRR